MTMVTYVSLLQQPAQTLPEPESCKKSRLNIPAGSGADIWQGLNLGYKRYCTTDFKLALEIPLHSKFVKSVYLLVAKRMTDF